MGELEIQELQYLLHSYHTVYRVQRLQQIRTRVRSTCIEPTTEQLEDIAQHIKNKTGRLFEAETVRRKLKKLAAQLREYRIYARGGSLRTNSLDVVNEGKYNSLLDELSAPSTSDIVEPNEEQAEFLQFYRHQLQISLQQALAKVTESRIRQLQRKKGDKTQIFLTALELSQCQKLAMKEIAQKLGMRAQDAVTKLLKLKELRSDVQQEMLIILKDSVKEKAKLYADIKALNKLDEQLTIVLASEISKIIENAESQSRTAKNYLKTDIFAEFLCEYLDIRKQANN
jgi:DNA-binding transcriptional regulator GbsR (MarR family)